PCPITLHPGSTNSPPVDIAPELSTSCGQRFAILPLIRHNAPPLRSATSRRMAQENQLVPACGTVLWSAFVRRVSVVGNSGSGKSTLARELAASLGVPHLELDSVYHQPGWEPLPEDEFRRLVTAKTNEDGWVIDGNYSALRSIVWAHADTVVWLDPPRWTVMRRVAWRT